MMIKRAHQFKYLSIDSTLGLLGDCHSLLPFHRYGNMKRVALLYFTKIVQRQLSAVTEISTL